MERNQNPNAYLDALEKDIEKLEVQFKKWITYAEKYQLEFKRYQ